MGDQEMDLLSAKYNMSKPQSCALFSQFVNAQKPLVHVKTEGIDLVYSQSSEKMDAEEAGRSPIFLPCSSKIQWKK